MTAKVTTDFLRLLAASKILALSGDTTGAKALIEAATGLVPGSDIGLCGKCIKRRQGALDALARAEAQLRDGPADGKREQAPEIAGNQR